MLLKCCIQYVSKFRKFSSDTRLVKFVFHNNSKKGNIKKCSNYCRITLISHASKEMLKIFQTRLQHNMNWELPDVQPRFRKARGARDKLPTSSGSLKKEESPRKTSAAAAKSLQLCPTLCDPIDGSPPGAPVPGILQARTLEWVVISFSNKESTSVHGIFQARVLEWGAIAFSKKNTYFCFTDYAKAFICVDHNKLWKILKQTGIPDHLTCLPRNLHASQ